MRRVPKAKIGPLLYVRWLDAHNYPVQWTTLDDMKAYVCEVHSVGWQIIRDDQQLVMSADLAKDDDDGTVMVNTTFAIPVGCILETTVLRRGDG